MADPLVLYVVTSIVLAGLAVWVVVVRMTAPELTAMPPLTAPQASKGGNPNEAAAKAKAAADEDEEDDDAGAADPAASPKPGGKAGKGKKKGKKKGNAGKAGRDAKRPEPTIVAKDDDEKPVSSSALVVALPTMRQRLDSHPEIDDSGLTEPYEAPESAPPGPASLNLATAMGRMDPAARKSNDDAFVILDRHRLFVVADGTGGKTADVASQLAVDTITTAFEAEDPKPPSDVRGLSRRANRLRRAVIAAHEKIQDRASRMAEHEGMRASAVAVHFSSDNQKVHVAHVGGARCYRVRHGAIALLTKPGGKTERLGTDGTLDVPVVVEHPQPDDIYVACSDGLVQSVPESDLLAAVDKAATLEEAAQKLVDLAKGKGREDVTTILVRVFAPE